MSSTNRDRNNFTGTLFVSKFISGIRHYSSRSSGFDPIIICCLSVPFKADSHIVGRVHAVPLPCRALIHTRHAAPLPCSDSVVSIAKVRMIAGNIRTASPIVTDRLFFLYCAATTLFLVHDKRCLVSHWPPASEIGRRLITTLVEFRVVAARSRMRAVSPQAVSRRACSAVVLRRRGWSEYSMSMV